MLEWQCGQTAVATTATATCHHPNMLATHYNHQRPLTCASVHTLPAKWLARVTRALEYHTCIQPQHSHLYSSISAIRGSSYILLQSEQFENLNIFAAHIVTPIIHLIYLNNKSIRCGNFTAFYSDRLSNLLASKTFAPQICLTITTHLLCLHLIGFSETGCFSEKNQVLQTPFNLSTSSVFRSQVCSCPKVCK